jgi:hypothetical protein
MYCPRQFGPSSLFSITRHPHSRFRENSPDPIRHCIASHHIDNRTLLTEEAEASRRGRNSNRLTPDNYEFQMVAQETLDSGQAYVLKVVSKTANKYLIDGKVWVDARTTPSFVLKVSRRAPHHCPRQG